MLQSIFDFLKDKDFKYKERVNLSKLSSLGIGAIAPLVVYPDSIEKLVELVKYLEKINFPYKIVGRMTNILFASCKIEFVIVATSHIDKIKFSADSVIAECGAPIPRIARLSAERNLAGFEQLSGIPASVGGAIRSNAGAYGVEISELIEAIEALDKKNGESVVLHSEDCDFSYRHSIFQGDRYVILFATFKLCFAEHDVFDRMEYFRQRRIATQPYGERSIGSTFKRPENGFAAQMIDECGLKGLRIGNVQVSEKHAGFIVNLGLGTANDYLELMSIVTRTVHERFGVLLEPEIEIF